MSLKTLDTVKATVTNTVATPANVAKSVQAKAVIIPKQGDTDLQAQIQALKAENEALRVKKAEKQTISVKITEKGGLSVYGLGRFPVTLYASQWEKLLGKAQDIKAFIEANRASFSVKE